MSKTVHYCLYSGKISKTTEYRCYSFSKTSNIHLSVSKFGFSIDVDRTVSKSSMEILCDPLFRDAIKKAVIIQLIKYSQIVIKDIYVVIDDETYCVYEKNNDDEQVLYSMCGRKLIREMNSNWSDSAIQRILNTTKSKANRIDASLDALLMAKSKVFETERFIYLWMAMNGLYGFAAEQAGSCMESKEKRDWIKNEYAQLKFWAMLVDYPYCHCPEKDKETSLLKRLEFLLANVDDDCIESFLLAVKMDDIENEYIKEMHVIFSEAGCNEGKMHPYAALLLYMPYKMRCKYFHAEKAVPLICFDNEHPLSVLRILNRIIEEYLDKNLTTWFDSIALENDILPKVKLISNNCICKNKRLISCVINSEEKV